jgi:hypothetical protein
VIQAISSLVITPVETLSRNTSPMLMGQAVAMGER